MVKPAFFQFNEETAVSNAFQTPKSDWLTSHEKAIVEFEKVQQELASHGIEVIVVNDTPNPIKPDAIFPNNRVSTHGEGIAVLYPMLTPNRQLEKQNPVLGTLQKEYGYNIKETLDLTNHEKDSVALEWTWSLLLDRVNHIAYVSLSPRANLKVLNEFCEKMWYTPLTFTSYNALSIKPDEPIYHTNVILSIGENFAVCCLDAIRDEDEKISVKNSLEQTWHEVINIIMDQMWNHFAGNMLTVKNNAWNHYTLMSQNAYDSLTKEQIQTLEKYVTIIAVAIPTIENIWWGSVRCMLLENFLPKQSTTQSPITSHQDKLSGDGC